MYREIKYDNIVIIGLDDGAREIYLYLKINFSLKDSYILVR